MVTWNPADKETNVVLTNGNLTAHTNLVGALGDGARATTGAIDTGKWYWESTCDLTHNAIGWASASWDLTTFNSSNSRAYYNATGNLRGSLFGIDNAAFGATYTAGDVIGLAIDFDAGLAWWSKNGVWQASGDPENGLNGQSFTPNSAFYPAFWLQDGQPSPPQSQLTSNFGATAFNTAPPTGFTALNEFGGPATVTSDSDIRWAVQSFVLSDLEVQWQVGFPVTNNLELQWLLRQMVMSDLDTQWKVTEPAQPPIGSFNLPFRFTSLIGIVPVRIF
jgi:hypothetical protein